LNMLDDIKKTLWATADKLRANMDAAEYKHLVLGLIFVKYISDTFAARRAELTARLTNPADEYFYCDATPADLEAELEDRDYYKEANVFWVPESARWESLRAAAKQPDIGKRIDDALTLIEVENPKLKGILDKRYARAQLPDGKLGELVDLVSTIGFGDDPAVRARRAGPGVRILPGHVCQRRGQARRAVLHPGQHRQNPGGRPGAAPRPSLRPLLRFRRHVRAERKVH
jgi:type I restriction enzyme M protein